MNTCNQYENIDTRTLYCLKKLQCLWRGYRVRKKVLDETRREFETIFAEIEQSNTGLNVNNNKLLIHWRNCHAICLPEIVNTNDLGAALSKENLQLKCVNNGTSQNDTTGSYDRRTDDVNSKQNVENMTCLQTVDKSDGIQVITEKFTGQVWENENDGNMGVCCEFGTQTEDIDTQEPSPGYQIPGGKDISSVNLLDTKQNLSNESVTKTNEKFHVIDELQDQSESSEQFSKPDTQNRSSSPVQCSTPVSSPRPESNPGRNVKREKLNPVESIKSPSRAAVEPTYDNIPVLDRNNILTESWMTDKSFRITGSLMSDPSDVPVISSYDGMTKEEIYKRKEDLSLELLWIHQAIKSRKQYLKMKNERR